MVQDARKDRSLTNFCISAHREREQAVEAQTDNTPLTLPDAMN